ncbi:MAG: hypothetical protein GY765_20175 [bacterium]|nr:hypothetical protein [bacterium]
MNQIPTRIVALIRGLIDIPDLEYQIERLLSDDETDVLLNHLTMLWNRCPDPDEMIDLMPAMTEEELERQCPYCGQPYSKNEIAVDKHDCPAKLELQGIR